MSRVSCTFSFVGVLEGSSIEIVLLGLPQTKRERQRFYVDATAVGQSSATLMIETGISVIGGLVICLKRIWRNETQVSKARPGPPAHTAICLSPLNNQPWLNRVYRYATCES